MLSHDELAPLIDAILSVAVTARDRPVDAPDAELRRLVLYALSRIEKRDPDGLRLLLDGLLTTRVEK